MLCSVAIDPPPIPVIIVAAKTKTFDGADQSSAQRRGSAGVSPANQPDKKLIAQIFIKYIFKYVINLKLGSSKIPHLPAGTPLAHIYILENSKVRRASVRQTDNSGKTGASLFLLSNGVD